MQPQRSVELQWVRTAIGPCKFILDNTEALPGVMGNRRIMSFISGEQGSMSKNEGNRGTNVSLESREHRKLRF